MLCRRGSLKLVLAGALLSLPLWSVAAGSDPVKVVYHMSEGIPQASRAMANIRNHLAADPTAKIVVVTHGLGIDTGQDRPRHLHVRVPSIGIAVACPQVSPEQQGVRIAG